MHFCTVKQYKIHHDNLIHHPNTLYHDRRCNQRCNDHHHRWLHAVPGLNPQNLSCSGCLRLFTAIRASALRTQTVTSDRL